jgi:hypothetical protein
VEKVNDVIWEFDASRDYDPSAGLGLIQARLLAVNFADDELNPVDGWPRTRQRAGQVRSRRNASGRAEIPRHQRSTRQ